MKNPLVKTSTCWCRHCGTMIERNHFPDGHVVETTRTGEHHACDTRRRLERERLADAACRAAIIAVTANHYGQKLLV